MEHDLAPTSGSPNADLMCPAFGHFRRGQMATTSDDATAVWTSREVNDGRVADDCGSGRDG